MSKATFIPTRACIFTVTCVDWQGHPLIRPSMARLYALTYRWETMDLDSGEVGRGFDDPVTLEVEANWTTCLSTVKAVVGSVTSRYGTASSSWEPLFLASDGGCADRLVKELNSFFYRWHAGRRVRQALDRYTPVYNGEGWLTWR